MPYDKIPSTATLAPKPFTANIPQDKLQQMLDILKVSPIGIPTWENTSKEQGATNFSDPTRKHGMRRDYLIHAKDYWLNSFDWRAHEKHINSFNNYTVDVTGSDGIPFNIHFVALFSEKPDAIPLVFYHGWPGSFLEFLGILTILQKKHTPQTLPYHVIVPSLPGYTFSSGPPIDVDYSLSAAADTLHHLMTGLGFKHYVAQGGDLGSAVARYQAAHFPECVSMHLNMCGLPPDVDREKNAHTMSDVEAKSLARGTEFMQSGFAYGREHGSRTATIGLVLSSSPLALLSWIGEKFLEWTDEDPSLETILESVSLYWLTETFPRCIYPYRENEHGRRRVIPRVDKGFGFSFFPKELHVTPRHLVEQTGNLVCYYSHEKGGHFAALEQPEILLADVEDWIGKVWEKQSKL